MQSWFRPVGDAEKAGDRDSGLLGLTLQAGGIS